MLSDLLDRLMDLYYDIRLGHRRERKRMLVKRSALWCVFHHPLKIIIRTLILFFVIGGFCNYFSDGHDFMESDFNFYLVLIVALIIATLIVKRRATKEYRLMEYNYYTPEMIDAERHHPFKSLKSILEVAFVGTMSAGEAFKNSGGDVPPPTMGDVMYGSKHDDNARRMEDERRANQEAYNRWYAQDMQKKAEWDARDAAMRGRDRAAQQRQNDADYWRNQSRR